jgi:hypothetical protein
VLYERFFAGDLNQLLASRFISYDRGEAVARVRALLAEEGSGVAGVATGAAARRGRT